MASNTPQLPPGFNWNEYAHLLAAPNLQSMGQLPGSAGVDNGGQIAMLTMIPGDTGHLQSLPSTPNSMGNFFPQLSPAPQQAPTMSFPTYTPQNPGGTYMPYPHSQMQGGMYVDPRAMSAWYDSTKARLTAELDQAAAAKLQDIKNTVVTVSVPPSVAATPVKAGRAPRDTKSEKILHAAMQGLLAVPVNGGEAPEVTVGTESGSAATTLENGDGVTLHSPNYNAGVTDSINDAYLEDCVDVALLNLKLDPTDPALRKLMKAKAKGYFRTQARTYKAQTSDIAADKSRRKTVDNRRNGRTKTKAHNRRKAVPKLKAIHGEENCQGVEAACNSDFMSSDYTDNEDDTPSTAGGPIRHPKQRQGSGGKVLNVPRLTWRSPSLEKILYRLDAINADEKRTRKKSAPGYRRVYLDATANDDDKRPPPTTTKRPVFRSWISKSYVERTGGTGIVFTEDDPLQYPILTLELPDELFSLDELARWEDEDADDEFEGDEPVGSAEKDGVDVGGGSGSAAPIEPVGPAENGDVNAAGVTGAAAQI